MGKCQDLKDKYGGTRILYKKSNNSINTLSRTCSGTSQMFTSGRILQIKKNLSQTKEHDTEGNKIKRDLSIETDFCILRRYYKNKRSRMSTKESSAKSKYSTIVDHEIKPIEEIPPDLIASGDSKSGNKLVTTDIATIMLENLKALLNKWIYKHLSENKAKNEKIETVLDQILQRSELSKSQRVSSISTYILKNKDSTRIMKNKKVETASDICQYCKRKSHPVTINLSKHVIYRHQSRNSVPLLIKKVRIISTLSIPKKKKHKDISLYKVKKIKHKNLLLSIDNSSKLLDCSSFNLLEISKRSLANHNSTINLKNHIKEDKTLHTRSSIKRVPHTGGTQNEPETSPLQNKFIKPDNLNEMSSLIKCIYANTPVNGINSIYKTEEVEKTVKDKCILTDIHNLKHITTNLIVSESKISVNHDKRKYTTEVGTENLNKGKLIKALVANNVLHKSQNELTKTTNQNIPCHKNNLNSKNYIYRKNIAFNTMRKKLANIYKLRKTENKHLTYFYKKSGSHISQSRDALKNLQNILQYFVNFKGNENIKFDVQVKVVPVIEGMNTIEKKDEYTSITNEGINKSTHTCEIKLDNEPNINQSIELKIANHCNSYLGYNQKIIPILDGAVSQAKYFNSENIGKHSNENKMITNQSSIKPTSKMVNDIHELKSVIKKISETTDQIIKEHIGTEINETNSKYLEHSNANSLDTTKDQLQNMSKGVQISNDFSKNVPLPGLKISKAPKKDAFEFYSRLMKKSTSYNIFDSESILKVTDMSVVNEINFQKFVDEGLTCSLPKSRSLFEVITENNKRKVLTYFCDDGCSKDSSVSFNKCNLPCHTCSLPRKSSMDCGECLECPISESNHNLPDCTSTIFIIHDDGNKGCNSKKKICSKRRGMGFGEGFIYCLLLWIPIIIIACLFYSYVIKDVIDPKPHKVHRLKIDPDQDNARKSTNKSIIFDLQLSDFGF